MDVRWTEPACLRVRTGCTLEVTLEESLVTTRVKLIPTCSIWRSLEVMGDTSTQLILQSALIGTHRFDDIRRQTGLLPTLLSQRLERLQAEGLLYARQYSDRPMRVGYHLTDKALDLYGFALMELCWERRWGHRENRVDVVLRHKLCGCDFDPTLTCLECDAEITLKDVAWRDGPGVGWMAPRYSRRRHRRHAEGASSVLVDEAIQIAGDRWGMLVFRAIVLGKRRFDEICRETSIATNVLSDRLSWLITKGMIETEDVPAPRRRQYALTKKGEDYFPVMLMLMQWGDKHYRAPEGPPLLPFHGQCGHQLKPAVTCSHCRLQVRPHDVEYVVVQTRPQRP